MRGGWLKASVACAALASATAAGGTAGAQAGQHGPGFWYSGGYRNPARGTWSYGNGFSHGRYFPNTHNPHRFIHAPGVVVRH